MFSLLKKSVQLCLLMVLFLPGTLWAQDQLILHSSLIPAPDTVWVFTPSTYNKSKASYPIVYLLHGYSGSYHQWNDITDLQKLANHFDFILVCPDGFFSSWYIDSPIKKDTQYKSFFFKVLMPQISNRYRVNENQAFITGLSMGGHGALYLFSQQPRRFLSAGSISGVVNLAAVGSSYELEELLGTWPQNRDRWKQFSVMGNLIAIKNNGKKIIFDVGRSDPFYNMNKALAVKADSLGIDATFITRPGGHNYTYWKQSLPFQLFFFKQLVNNKK